jgi:hypothetical protein
MVKIFSLLGISVVLLMSSCSIDKKLYSSGYHMEWNSKASAPAKTSSVQNVLEKTVQSNSEIASKDSVPESKGEPELLASIEKAGFHINEEKIKYIFKNVAFKLDSPLIKTNEDKMGIGSNPILINKYTEKPTNTDYKIHHWWTMGGIVVGGTSGFLLAYEEGGKPYNQGLNGLYDIFGGFAGVLVGALIGYIIDEVFVHR